MTSPPGPPTVTLRPAVPEDAPVLAAVWEPGWHDAHDGHVPAALTALRTAESFVARAPGLVPGSTVAVVDGRVVGFVTVADDQVDQLYVAADARGSGVAAALLAHAAASARGAGRAALWLAVAPGNARARRFYERQGWVDGGPLDHVVPGPGGTTVTVPVRRYTLTLDRAPHDHTAAGAAPRARRRASPGPTTTDRRAVPATALLTALLTTQVGPRLRELGLRGSGTRWSLPDPRRDHALLTFQRSTGNDADEAGFTANLLACTRQQWDAAVAREPWLGARPSASTHGGPGWQERLGLLLDPAVDRWWHVRAGTDLAGTGAVAVVDDVVHLVEHVALPHLRARLAGEEPPGPYPWPVLPSHV